VVEDSVNWLRNNELKPEDVNEPTLRLDETSREQCRRAH
jgi:hypothetical protein